MKALLTLALVGLALLFAHTLPSSNAAAVAVDADDDLVEAVDDAELAALFEEDADEVEQDEVEEVDAEEEEDEEEEQEQEDDAEEDEELDAADAEEEEAADEELLETEEAADPPAKQNTFVAAGTNNRPTQIGISLPGKPSGGGMVPVLPTATNSKPQNSFVAPGTNRPDVNIGISLPGKPSIGGMVPLLPNAAAAAAANGQPQNSFVAPGLANNRPDVNIGISLPGTPATKAPAPFKVGQSLKLSPVQISRLKNAFAEAQPGFLPRDTTGKIQWPKLAPGPLAMKKLATAFTGGTKINPTAVDLDRIGVGPNEIVFKACPAPAGSAPVIHPHGVPFTKSYMAKDGGPWAVRIKGLVLAEIQDGVVEFWVNKDGRRVYGEKLTLADALARSRKVGNPFTPALPWKESKDDKDIVVDLMPLAFPQPCTVKGVFEVGVVVTKKPEGWNIHCLMGTVRIP